MPHPPVDPVSAATEMRKAIERRRFLQSAAAGTVITILGGVYAVSDWLTSEAQAAQRPDGRPQLPPGQRVIRKLRPMGGSAGDSKLANFRLKVHGEVDHPFELSFRDLLAQPRTKQRCDVHCVTGWSVLGAEFEGVRVDDLAKKAGVKRSARHVIFEAAHGYTSNVRLDEALAKNVLVTWRLDGRALPAAHGGPVRILVPDLYFWKSAKWLTGIRFSRVDQPGYWERRGYNNHADPWKEERYS